MHPEVALRRRIRRLESWGWIVATCFALPLCIAIAVTIGPADISFAEVWSTIARKVGFDPGLDVVLVRQRIVWELRLPRALLAGCVGAGLALCGVILQSLTRNPLADPYLLGISSGASVGAVLAIVIGFGGSAYDLPVAAFVGALVAFACVLLLAGGGAARSTAPLILAGVATTHLFSALSSLITLLFADENATRGVFFWLLGSLSAARWPEVVLAAIVLLVVVAISLHAVNALDGFAFGNDAAAALGIRVERTRMTLFIATAALTATLVAFSGAIGFIGLVIPHAARLLVGSGHARLLPAALVMGAIFTIMVDTFARTAFAPREVAVGVITAIIGVPAFSLILYRHLRR